VKPTLWRVKRTSSTQLGIFKILGSKNKSEIESKMRRTLSSYKLKIGAYTHFQVLMQWINLINCLIEKKKFLQTYFDEVYKKVKATY